MTRALTSTAQAELAKAQIVPVLFVELDFASGFIRMWSGVGPISWTGQTWTGGGELLEVSSIEETTAVEATAAAITLSGVPSTLVAVAYSDFSQGRPVRIWLGLLDVNSGAVLSDPVQIFAGRMDTIGDSDSGETATIAVSAESNLADLDRLRARFYTDQDQARIFEGDRSLRYIPSIQDRPITWGSAGNGNAPQAAQL
jgi:hypothetical protein